MKTALLLIDIQNDYFPGGAMELEESQAAAEKAGRLLGAFRDQGLPVIHVQHIADRPGATFFLPGTPGVEIHDRVRPSHGEKVITKHLPNSFRDTPLLGTLQKSGIDHLVICGMMTHMCVDATVRAAFDLGFACSLVHNACATKTLTYNDTTVPAGQVHAAFLAALGAVYARIAGVEEIIRDLHPDNSPESS